MIDNFRHFLGSKFGLAATIAAAVLGAYLLLTHTGHALAALPYVLLLACPLMHLVGHRHGSHHDSHHGADPSAEPRR